LRFRFDHGQNEENGVEEIVQDQYNNVRDVLDSCRGVYTVLKVVDVDDVQFHTNRLCKGYTLLGGESEIQKRSLLIQRVLFHSMERFSQEYNGILCLIPISGDLSMNMYGMNTSPRPINCSMDVGLSFNGGCRSLPNAKDSKWSMDRREIEQTFVNVITRDILLMDPESSALYEGLLTNVFVLLENRKVQTAPSEYVLEGCARQGLLDKLERKGFRILYECANWCERDSWRGMYLTNSLRGIEWVDRILDEHGMVLKSFSRQFDLL